MVLKIHLVDSDYIVFKDIYSVYDATLNSGAVYGFRRTGTSMAQNKGIYRSLDGGNMWAKMGELQIDAN